MGAIHWQEHFQRLMPGLPWRKVWRLLPVLSLLLLGLGTFYVWRAIPTAGFQASPLFLVLAVAIYVTTYAMNVIGWHNLSALFIGRHPFRTSLEAVAISSLVKYLPTIAWYIASRVDYYGRIQVPRRLVVAASLTELTLIIGLGALFFVLFWVAGISYLMVPVVLAMVIGSLLISSYLPWTRRVAGKIYSRLHLEAVDGQAQRPSLIIGLSFYAGTWLGGVLFLAAVLRTFLPLNLGDLLALSQIWVTAGLAGYFLSITLGSLGMARELTLIALLAAIWSLPAAVMTAVIVKLVLTVGEMVCSLAILACLYLMRGES